MPEAYPRSFSLAVRRYLLWWRSEGEAVFYHSLLIYLTRIQRPGELRHSKSENKVIDELTSSPFWIRVAGFQSCEFGQCPL
jgi:hypothetical protein